MLRIMILNVPSLPIAATLLVSSGLALTGALAAEPQARSSIPMEGYFAAPVKRVTLLTEQGGRVDWSFQNRIAFDRKGPNGYYEIWVMNPDGSGQRCLTCDQTAAPTKHKGNPAWHPSGEYIVFQAQKENTSGLLKFLAAPGRGVENDLWVMDSSGTRYWKIVDVHKGFPASGTLHPHFSRDGTKLFWSQLRRGGGKLGVWDLRIGTFQVGPEGPYLTDVRDMQPGPVHKFFESHGFTPDGRKILFTAQTQTGYADEFLMDLASGEITNLSRTPNQWSEHGQISPDGRRIVWATNRGETKRYLNLWLMNLDGSDQREIVNFHHPGTPLYTEGIGPADSSWSPDSRRLVVYGITDERETQGKIYLVDFDF